MDEVKKTSSEEIADSIDEELKRLDAEERADGINAMIEEEVAGLEASGAESLTGAASAELREAMDATFEDASKKNAESFVGLVESLGAHVNPEDFVKLTADDIAAAIPQMGEGKARELMQVKAGKAFKKAAKEMLEGKIISLSNSEEIKPDEAKMIEALEKALDGLEK